MNRPAPPTRQIALLILADVVHEIGLPAGVFNLVTGLGPPFGEMLVRHPRVDMISFTGSTAGGRPKATNRYERKPVFDRPSNAEAVSSLRQG